MLNSLLPICKIEFPENPLHQARVFVRDGLVPSPMLSTYINCYLKSRLNDITLEMLNFKMRSNLRDLLEYFAECAKGRKFVDVGEMADIGLIDPIF